MYGGALSLQVLGSALTLNKSLRIRDQMSPLHEHRLSLCGKQTLVLHQHTVMTHNGMLNPPDPAVDLRQLPLEPQRHHLRLLKLGEPFALLASPSWQSGSSRCTSQRASAGHRCHSDCIYWTLELEFQPLHFHLLSQWSCPTGASMHQTVEPRASGGGNHKLLHLEGRRTSLPGPGCGGGTCRV